MNICLLVLYLYSTLLIITNKDQVGNKDETKQTNSNRHAETSDSLVVLRGTKRFFQHT